MGAKSFACTLLLIASSVVHAWDSVTDPYDCFSEGAPTYHDYDLLMPGESRVVDLKPNCTGILNPENYMQLIIGVTTPAGGYLKVSGRDFLTKIGLQADLIDTETGISMFSQVISARGQICRYAAGLSYEFYNPQFISPVVLRPLKLRLTNIGSKSYQVQSTVTWIYKPEGAPVGNCLKYDGRFM